jgi:hypothetical protein
MTIKEVILEGSYSERVVKELPRNTVIYSIVRSVSQSGMSRNIDFFVIKDDKPIWITPALRDILDYKQDKKYGALKVNGTGMDMCFHIVNSLGYKLHNDGYFFKSERL